MRAAINDYYRRHGMQDKIKEERAHLVCKCMNVTDREIEQAVLEGVRTFYGLQERTKIGTVCGKCEPGARRLLNEYIQKHFGQK